MIDQKDTISKENLKDNTARVGLRVVSDRVSESFSTVLKKTREKKGLSIRQAADALHLSGSIVSALEEGRLDFLPADIYTTGYIRSYAALLELNPEGLVKDYKQSKELLELNARDRLLREQQINQQVTHEEEPAFEKMVHLLANKWLEFRRDYLKQIIIATVIGILAVVFLLQFFPETEIESVKQIDKVKVLSADGSLHISDLDAMNQKNVGQVIPDNRLKMAFSDTTWVIVRDKNQALIHQSREQKGANIEISGQAPFYLNLSNASAAIIYFNDRVIDYSAQLTDDNQLREFVIAP